MCTNSGSNDSTPNRRRSHQDMMLQSNRGGGAYQSTKVPMATIYSSGSGDRPANTNDGAVIVENSGIFRSHTARIIALVFAIALIATSLISANNNRGSNLKELSDTVMNLSQELKKLDEENKKKEQNLAALEKELEDKKIELAWEEQHVHDSAETQDVMYKTLTKEIRREQEIISETTEAASHFAQDGHQARKDLKKEHDENAQLKVALAMALEELATARAKLPAAPNAKGGADRGGANSHGGMGNGKGEDTSMDVNKGRGWKDKDLDDKVKERRLRGQSPWQPGDNVEIVEDEGGKVALRPGIVTELNTDGTYNIVKLEASVVKNNIPTSLFQTYHAYPPGSAAMFEERQNVYVPITIVRFLRDSARIGFELHGKYEYTLDSDAKGEVRVCTAMRIHRIAADGEIVGADNILASQRDPEAHHLKVSGVKMSQKK